MTTRRQAEQRAVPTIRSLHVSRTLSEVTPDQVKEDQARGDTLRQLFQSPSPSTPSRSPGMRHQQSTSPSTVRRPKRPTRERRPPAWLRDYQTD
ncbi:hypothetical protein HPB50_004889 [Hyalomma asiaticum]|uniref:Uncharacterized protein n=1 Tax=Hyalomma asiaticum TaxID=266040 RepID=A0ACB7SCR8_HYAAI|nr:hypothetical protein HPB50_004889 [Hyalomma asiaticum]